MNIKRLKVILSSGKPGYDRAISVLAWLAENEIAWSASQGYNLHGRYSDHVYVRIGSVEDGVVGSDAMFTMAVIYAAGQLVQKFDRL